MTKPGKIQNASTPTVKEVARLAEVSTATVSRVMSGAEGVRRELVRRVRAAADQLGYQPNPAGRSLRMRSTRTVGMVFPDIENPFYASVISGAEQVLQDAGYSLLLANYGEDPARENIQLTSLRAEHVAGILFAASCKPSADYQSVLNAGIALVAVSRIPDRLQVDLATVSNQEGARQAVAHLINLGHRRIGFVDGPVALSTTRERHAGYAGAFRDQGLAVPTDLTVYADYFHHNAGFQAVTHLLRAASPPTAILAVSNNMVLGSLEALRRQGLDVPRDMAIVGFGDSPSAALLQPPLTVVAQPAREIGAAGARLLLDRLQRPGAARRSVVLDTQLIIRESCGAKIRTDPTLPVTPPARNDGGRRRVLGTPGRR